MHDHDISHCVVLFGFAAENLGFTSYAAAYLSPQASGKNLLLGANFASAGSGYDDTTAELSVSIIFFFVFINQLLLKLFSHTKMFVFGSM